MNYHSTKSEREIIKNLGLNGNGTRIKNDGYHDLDEVIASPRAVWKRPWWVRRVDKPTIEIDWDHKQRFDGRLMQQVSWSKYIGEDTAKRLNELRWDRTLKWMKEVPC
jgi:epoxyqueuosine reductase